MHKTVKLKGRDVAMDGEVMYLRLMAVNAKKKVCLERVMSFENAPVPLSLFREDQTMIPADNKADFMHKLEDLVPGPKKTLLEGADSLIFDGHAVIRALQPHEDTTPIAYTFH
jgi:hypothetical protein